MGPWLSISHCDVGAGKVARVRSGDRIRRPTRDRTRSDLEPLVLEVEVPLDAVHHLGVDVAGAAQLDDGPPLGVERSRRRRW